MLLGKVCLCTYIIIHKTEDNKKYPQSVGQFENTELLTIVSQKLKF